MSRYLAFSLCSFFSCLLTIANAQKVGIGTTSPNALLEVTDDVLIYDISAGRGGGGDSISTNTVFGNLGLTSNTNGFRNTAFGKEALRSNISGNFNTASGAFTLLANTTGEENSAFGNSALGSNITGSWNTAFGSAALYNNISGRDNTALGYFAGVNNVTGSYNLFLGSASNAANDSLNNASAIGYRAFVADSNCMVLGSIAGVNGAAANTKVGIGTTSPTAILDVAGDILINGISAGRGGDSVASNTVFGYLALSSNTDGFRNSSYGYLSMVNNLTGDQNVAYGGYSLNANTSGSYNCAFGDFSLINNTMGSANVAIGRNALWNNMTGNNNAALGFFAGSNNHTGSKNLFVGYHANAQNSNFTNASAIGSHAYVNANNSMVLGSINGVNGGMANTNVGIGTTSPDAMLEVAADILVNSLTVGRGSGNQDQNIAIGKDALQVNTTGNSNTAIGHGALNANTTGIVNTALGAFSLFNNTTGIYNSAEGYGALWSNSTGSSNTGYGRGTLFSNSTGNNNTALGSNAGYNSLGADNLFVGGYANTINHNLTNASAIGYRAAVATSNSMVLGSIAGVNEATANTNVGIGTTSPIARLHVEGTLKASAWHSSSMSGNGYADMGNVRVQWGSIAYTSNNAVTINFPIAYSNVFSVTATVDAGANTGSGANIPVKVMNITNGSFQVAGTAGFAGDGISKVRWMAIGI